MLHLSSELQRIHLVKGVYLVRLARDEQDIDQLTRMRFKVFQQELKAGSGEVQFLGKDQDRYDSCCHHLIVTDQTSGGVVGTYRMQTYAMAKQHYGFYSSQEFDLSPVPQDILNDGVEIGRACILKEHRDWRTFLLLWQGIAAYLQVQNKHYLFGCSSLMSEDIGEGYAILDYLREKNLLHQDFWVHPTAAYQCSRPAMSSLLSGTDTQNTDQQPIHASKVLLPKLLQVYLKFGARVCSDPALDRAFRSIDFFTTFNINHLTQKHSPFYVTG